MSDGWVKLHRALQDNPRFKDPEWLSVWMYLLLNATHAPRAAVFDGKRIELRPGQLVTGRISISESTGVHPSKVYRVLETMKTEHQIEQQAGVKSSVITVRNWSLYQSCEQQSEQQSSNSRTPTEQQSNTNKNGRREEVAEREGAPVEPLPRFPKSEAEAKAACASLGCDEEFAVATWNKAMGRGGRDAKDVPIRSWPNHLASEWGYERQRRAKQQTPVPSGHAGTSTSGTPLWQQAKLLKEQISKIDGQLSKLFVPRGPLYEDEAKRVRAERAPLLEDKRKLNEQLDDVNSRMTAAGQ